MRFQRCLLVGLMLHLLCLSSTHAASRVALVIGNGAYQEQPLTNPPNDAEDMVASLRRLGFEVIHERDATLPKMKAAVRGFARQLVGAQVGVFYYAGHGIQQAGRNYLLPVDSDIATATDLEFYALDAAWVLGHMDEAGVKLKIMILDACRNNPFRWHRGSQDRGLARLDGPSGTLIAYATQPGNVAKDGEGRNGTYTKHLLSHLERPGLSILEMFNKTGLSVRDETAGRQDPWISFASLPEFCFAGCTPPPVAQPERPRPPVASQEREPAPEVPGESTEVRRLRQAAEEGDAQAQFNLAWRYDQGNGVKQSDTEAVRWYQKAAEQGNALAQTNLGWMYAQGRGVKQSDTEAVRWYQKAAAQGHAEAKNRLKELGR